MRFRDVYKTATYIKFNGKTISIEGKLYDIDIFPFVEDDHSSRTWIRARRIYDCVLYSTEKGMCGFSYDNSKVEKTLFEIKRRIFDELYEMGYVTPVEYF